MEEKPEKTATKKAVKKTATTKRATKKTLPKAAASDFSAHLERIRRAKVEAEINEHTRAIMVTNPGNPTGAVLTPEEMRMLVDVAKAHDLFIIGDEGVLYSPKMHLIGKPIVLPKSKTAVAKSIPASLPRVKYGDHRLNFVEAVRGDIPQAVSNFTDIAKLTEVVLLGNLTLRTGEDVVWDAKAMRAIGGSARMNSFIDAPMRPGWY